MTSHTLPAGTRIGSLPEPIFVASNLDDLDRLRRRGMPRRPGAIRLALPGLEEGRRADFERRLQRHDAACGCNEGTVAGLLYLVLVPLLLLAGWLAPRSLLAWISVVGGLFASLVAGKVFGLVVARQRFRRVLNDLERALLSREHGGRSHAELR